jgi:chromosome segregation ATPase
MDLNQATQMITWLDEERRRDRGDLVKAQQRLEGQSGQIEDLTHTVQSLEGRLASAMAQLTRMDRIERAMEQLRNEIVLMIQKQEEERRQADRETARARLIEQENLSKTLADIRKELPRIQRLEEELQLRRAEEQRLGEAALTLQQRIAEVDKDLETRLRNLPYIEEQRVRDARRIAALQGETTELLKRTEAQVAKLSLLDEQTQRHKSQIEQLTAGFETLRQEQRAFVEEVQIKEQQRQRQMSTWEAEFAAYQERMDEYGKRMQRSTEQYELVKKALAELEQLEERLLRNQNEVAELQRIAEERQKQQLEHWDAEQEKRWKRQLLLWEQQWHDHDRRNDEQLARLDVVEERSADNEAQVAALWEAVEEQARHLANTAQQWVINVGEIADRFR